MPGVPNNREGPQEREPSKCLNGQSNGERLAKEAFWSPAVRGLKKYSDRALTPAIEAVHVPAHLVPPGSLWPKQLCHFHAQHSLGQNCHGQKKKPCIYAHGVTSVMSNSLKPCRLWPARLLCRGWGWWGWGSLGKNFGVGFHTFLDHYISCCSSCQLLWVPGAARIPATQATAPPAPMALTGAFLQGSLSSKYQWMIHMHRWR